MNEKGKMNMKPLRADWPARKESSRSHSRSSIIIVLFDVNGFCSFPLNSKHIVN